MYICMRNIYAPRLQQKYLNNQSLLLPQIENEVFLTSNLAFFIVSMNECLNYHILILLYVRTQFSMSENSL